jgi:plastocyanin
MNRALRNGLIMIAGTVVVLGGLVAWVAIRQEDKPAPRTAATAKTREVVITDQGFEPKSLLVKKGTVVKWVNQTQAPHSVGANPYPERTDLPELNSAAIAPNSSYSFSFGTTGTFSYSDYTDPTKGGEIVVE